MSEQETDPPGSFELRPTLKMLGRLLGSAAIVSILALATAELILRACGLPTGEFSSVRRAYDLDEVTLGPYSAGSQVELMSPRGDRHLVKFNSLGCRGSEPDLGKAPTILCVGDSLTFGYGVQDSETWPAQLQARLRGEGFHNPVVNLSSAHLLIEDETRYLERALPALRPEVVILLMPPGGYGDAVDTMRRTPHEKSRARERSRRVWPRRAWYTSAIYEAQTEARQWRKLKSLEGHPAPMPGIRGGGDGLVYLRGRYAQKVAAFQQKVTQGGARLVLAAFPKFRLEDGITYEEPWTASLRQLPGALYVDVKAAFVAAGGGEDLLLLPDDSHASARGCRVLADAVFEVLRENGALR